MISVIVPVYNVENVLHYCIESILAQTYRDFELILINDGSTDGSGAVCDRYAETDDRIRVIHKKNGGVSSARNSGIDSAAGEFICFVDSDDYVDERYLVELVAAKKNNKEIDNIWCCFQIADTYGVLSTQNNLIRGGEETLKFNKKGIMTLHECWLDAGPVCKLYEVPVIHNNRLRFDEDVSLGEDLVFNFRYIDKTNGEILVINKALYFYMHIDDSSLSRKYYPDLFDIYVKNNSIMKHYLIKWGCDEVQLSKFYNSCLFLYERALENTFHKQSRIKCKHHYNRRILCSVEFKGAVKKSNCFIHPCIMFAYRIKSYRLAKLVYAFARKKKNI